MNRLQKKCVIASAGLHLLLVIVVLIGPAFLSPASKPIDVQLIDFIAVKTTDENKFGGGNPNAALPPAPPAPPVQRPVVDQAKQAKPDPAKDDSPSLEPAKHVVTPNLKQARRNDTSTSNKPTAAQQKEIDARNRELAASFSKAAEGIKGGVSSSTKVEYKGVGGGGVPYANWYSGVKSRYSDAWIVPDGVTDASAAATVSVTIGRDGRVITWKMTRPSGNGLVDSSVESVMERVKYAAPLPESTSEDQRTVSITFDVRAKLVG